MSDIVFRKGTRVMLRPLERADAPTLRRWMNDPQVTEFLIRVLPMMERETEEWIDNLAGSKTDFVFGITKKKGGKLIGTVGLHNVNMQHRTASTTTAIGEKAYWGKGFGTEAKMLLLDFAFNALDLQTILSYVMTHNDRCLDYNQKCGYEVVGRIPSWLRRQNGERCDVAVLTVTQEKWRPLWKAYVAKEQLGTK